MKDKLFLLFTFIFLVLIFGCKSSDITTPEPVSEIQTQIEEPALVEEEPIEDEPEIEEAEEITEEEEVYFEEDEVETIDEVVVTEDNEEYLRSTNELSVEEVVSKEEFEEDKAEILSIIAELSEIMEKNDVKSWLKYIDPESIKYYSTAANVRKAQKKLPDKTIQLHGINDYFKYVFIPARKRSNVDEIRYISKTNVKAVQVKADESTVIYYYFVKIDGKWLVHIPPLD